MTKAKRITLALRNLEAEYRASSDQAENACAETVRRINVDLPDYSKERLFDILMSNSYRVSSTTL